MVPQKSRISPFLDSVCEEQQGTWSWAEFIFLLQLAFGPSTVLALCDTQNKSWLPCFSQSILNLWCPFTSRSWPRSRSELLPGHSSRERCYQASSSWRGS